MSVAIVGATGAVGREMIDVLVQRGFPYTELKLLASKRSAGMEIELPGATDNRASTAAGTRRLTVDELTPESLRGVDIALFSAGGAVSKQYAPIAIEHGCIVIDNSSAFRMTEGVPLVVPEVNPEAIGTWERGTGAVIANPNCSTIIALLAVAPLHRAVGVSRVVVSTYQSASGGGAAYMNELLQQTQEYIDNKPYTTDVTGRQYVFNVFSHNSAVGPNGYNDEELKLERETHKILDDDSVKITATCVRVPVLRAHSESINLTFAGSCTEDEAREILRKAPGVEIVDDRAGNKFPEPIHASGKDDVLVGRIRADHSQPAGKGLNLFVAGDQLRKGAALNAVQIAELLIQQQPRTLIARKSSQAARV